MSNVFFNWSFDVAPGSTNRSRPVENEFAAIGTGSTRSERISLERFSRMRVKLLRYCRPKSDRANKSFVWDALGNPAAAVAATSLEMTAAVAAATVAQDSATAATTAAGTVSNSTSYIHQLMLAQGVR